MDYILYALMHLLLVNLIAINVFAGYKVALDQPVTFRPGDSVSVAYHVTILIQSVRCLLLLKHEYRGNFLFRQFWYLLSTITLMTVFLG